MEHIGIDVHKNQSQVCILTADAELIEKRIRTDRDRFTAVLGSRPRAKILIEASTESEWVARLLEQLGHVLPTVFDDEAAAIIRNVIEQMGIEVITGERAVEFTGNGHVQSVVTSMGEIECDNVVLSVGIRPAVELAEKAGVDDRHWSMAAGPIDIDLDGDQDLYITGNDGWLFENIPAGLMHRPGMIPVPSLIVEV